MPYHVNLQTVFFIMLLYMQRPPLPENNCRIYMLLMNSLKRVIEPH